MAMVQTVYTALVDTLTRNPDLKNYNVRVFKGIRYNIDPDNLPCIMIEPVQDQDVERDFNQQKNVFFDVDVVGVTYNVDAPDKAIVGDRDYKGILDLSSDIRACLQSSNTLGGIVLDTDIQPALFEHEDIFETKYPTRVVVIPVRVLYRQTEGV